MRAVMAALDDRGGLDPEYRSECDILNSALWAKGQFKLVYTGSLGVMGRVVFGTAFVYHYDDQLVET